MKIETALFHRVVTQPTDGDLFDRCVDELAAILTQMDLVGEQALLSYADGAAFQEALQACLTAGVEPLIAPANPGALAAYLWAGRGGRAPRVLLTSAAIERAARRTIGATLALSGVKVIATDSPAVKSPRRREALAAAARIEVWLHYRLAAISGIEIPAICLQTPLRRAAPGCDALTMETFLDAVALRYGATCPDRAQMRSSSIAELALALAERAARV